MGSTVGTLLPVVLGAVLGFLPNYLLERRRENAQLRTRWDTALFGLCSDFIGSARALDELSFRYAEPSGADADIAERLAAEHQRLRSLSEQIRLLGDAEVQIAVRWVVRHAYAVREVAEGRADPRGEEFAGRGPRARLRDALDAVYLAVRAQLRVPNAAVIAQREPEPSTAPAPHRPGR